MKKAGLIAIFATGLAGMLASTLFCMPAGAQSRYFFGAGLAAFNYESRVSVSNYRFRGILSQAEQDTAALLELRAGVLDRSFYAYGNFSYIDAGEAIDWMLAEGWIHYISSIAGKPDRVRFYMGGGWGWTHYKRDLQGKFPVFEDGELNLSGGNLGVSAGFLLGSVVDLGLRYRFVSGGRETIDEGASLGAGSFSDIIGSWQLGIGIRVPL